MKTKEWYLFRVFLRVLYYTLHKTTTRWKLLAQITCDHSCVCSFNGKKDKHYRQIWKRGNIMHRLPFCTASNYIPASTWKYFLTTYGVSLVLWLIILLVCLITCLRYFMVFDNVTLVLTPYIKKSITTYFIKALDISRRFQDPCLIDLLSYLSSVSHVMLWRATLWWIDWECQIFCHHLRRFCII